MLKSIGSVRRALMCLCLSLVSSSFAWSQINNVTNDQATPTAGAGHDYLKMVNETVNPANGSVSLRIAVPTPKGRGLTIPFAFAYDSGAGHVLTSYQPDWGVWTSSTNFITQGGWTYAVPMLSAVQGSRPSLEGYCYWYSDYSFQDSQGSRHALGIADAQTPNDCGVANPQPTWRPNGGDDFLSAHITTGDTGLGTIDLCINNAIQCPSGGNSYAPTEGECRFA